MHIHRSGIPKKFIAPNLIQELIPGENLIGVFRQEMQKLKLLERDGIIDFSELPIIETRIREILLKWISDAMESEDYTARTDDGRTYILDINDNYEKCVVHCEDGNFTMPKMKIVFKEEG